MYDFCWNLAGLEFCIHVLLWSIKPYIPPSKKMIKFPGASPRKGQFMNPFWWLFGMDQWKHAALWYTWGGRVKTATCNAGLSRTGLKITIHCMELVALSTPFGWLGMLENQWRSPWRILDTLQTHWFSLECWRQSPGNSTHLWGCMSARWRSTATWRMSGSGWWVTATRLIWTWWCCNAEGSRRRMYINSYPGSWGRIQLPKLWTGMTPLRLK